MMDTKSLYTEAQRLYDQVRNLMDGNPTREQEAEADRLLDQMEALLAQAKRQERLERAGELFSPQPAPAVYTEKREPGAMERFLRFGETKGLLMGEGAAGGFLVPDEFRSEIIRKAAPISAMRRIARVLDPVRSGTIITPTEESALSDAEWTTELAAGSEDVIKPFGERRLTPHPLAKRIRASNDLLRTIADVEAYIQDAFATRFAVAEEGAFIQGDGVGKPLGLLNTPSLPTYTTATAVTLAGDDIINWVYSLPAAYAREARILCNRSFIRKVRALKDTTGQYLWQPGLQGGMPNTILDIPYEVSDQFPTGLSNDSWVGGSIVAVVGDFRRGYWIVDALEMTIQRLEELYAETNQTGFIGRKASDGMCVLPEAFYALKIKAS